MKYLAASSTSVGFISIFATLGTFIGLFYFDFTMSSILTSVLFYYLYSGIGLGMMFHRFWTHKTFEFKSKYIKWLLTWFGLMAGRGSVLGWVYVHRIHHAFSDTDKDPHHIMSGLIRLFVPMFTSTADSDVNKRVIRDLLVKEQIDINKYYNALILAWVLVLFLINPWLAYFVWFVPIFISNIVWNAFIMYGHSYKIGYQNFEETDDSSNNSWLFSLLILGEGWHNNHHKYPALQTTTVKSWEFDPIFWIIKLVKK